MTVHWTHKVLLPDNITVDKKKEKKKTQNQNSILNLLIVYSNSLAIHFELQIQ